MEYKAEIPGKILKDYFILHDEIKSICRHSPLEALNPEILNQEADKGFRAKIWFYINMVISLMALIISVYMFPYFLVFYLEASQTNDTLQSVSRNFAGFIAGVALLFSMIFGFNAARHFRLINGNVKKHLTAKARHPAKAKLIYGAVHKVINQKIPVGAYNKGRVQKIPLHNMFRGSKQNAMLVLLGDDRHRQALWRDGPVPKGPILIHQRYYDKILGELARTIKAFKKSTKDTRDNRPLVTALLNKKHLQSCYEVMNSQGFRQDHRISAKRERIIKIIKTLIDNWPLWEKFRDNVKVSLILANNKEHEFHKFADKLLVICESNKVERFNILTGKDRAAATFFVELEAIVEPDLVPKNTSVERKF